MYKSIQYLQYLAIYLTIALLACLVIGCTPAAKDELESKPTMTIENYDEEAEPAPRATVTTAAVEKEAKVTSEFSVIAVEAGIPFELGIDETVRLGETDFDLTFETIVQDGRCPLGGACMWEGEAEVQFLLASSDRANTFFTLKIPGLVETPFTDNLFLELAGFRFKLLQLEPYPADGDPFQLSEYRALLLFRH